MKVTLSGGACDLGSAFAELPWVIHGVKGVDIAKHSDGEVRYMLMFPTAKDAAEAAASLGLMDPLGGRIVVLQTVYGLIKVKGMLYTHLEVERR